MIEAASEANSTERAIDLHFHQHHNHPHHRHYCLYKPRKRNREHKQQNPKSRSFYQDLPTRESTPQTFLTPFCRRLLWQMKSKHIPQEPQECVAGLVKIFYPLFKPRVLQPVTLYVMRNTTIPETVNVNGHIQPAHPWFARICAQGTVDVPRGCKVHRAGNQTVIQISPHCRLTMCCTTVLNFLMGASLVLL